MMVIDFLEQLKKSGITLTGSNGDLKVRAPRNLLTDDVTKEIRRRKEEIIQHLELQTQFTNRRITPVAAVRYPLSYTQERFWALEQIQETSSNYIISRCFVLTGVLNLGHLQEAIDQSVDRHEILRTVFIEDKQGVCQQVLPVESCVIKIRYEDVSDLTEQDLKVSTRVAEEQTSPFNLAQGPLFRLKVIRLASNRHLFVYSLHHIIGDSWSINTLVREVLNLYNGLTLKFVSSLPPLTFQFKDFATWERRWINNGLLAKSESFWLNTLSGELPVLDLSFGGKTRPTVMRSDGKRYKMSFDSVLKNRINLLLSAQRVTMFSFLMATLKGAFSKITGSTDIIIGTPTAGRTSTSLENQLGPYMNTVAIRTQLPRSVPFSNLLKGEQEAIVLALSNEAYPFSLLVKKLELKRDASRSPVFDVMLSFQAADHLHGKLDLPCGIAIENALAFDDQTSKFDQLFSVTEFGDHIDIELNFNSSVFDEREIERICDYWKTFVTQVVNNPSICLSDIECIDASERHVLLSEFNNTKFDYPEDCTLVEMFEKNVELFPDRIAICFNDVKLTYRSLNRAANFLANYLRDEVGIGPDDRVALMMDKSHRMIIALLGILKAGGAYVPVDPDYPADRKKFIIENSEARILLTDDACLPGVPAAVKYFSVDSPLQGEDGNPPLASGPNDLAYIIYTSGSTGHPKGAMLETRSVVNRIDWMYRAYDFTSEDVILQKTPFVFDVSVWELFLPLCYGARMVLCPKNIFLDPRGMAELIARERVTTIHFVPGLYNVFIEVVQKELLKNLRTLRHVFVSGEELSVATVARHYKCLNIPLHNLYGPTEAAVDVTYYTASKNDRLIPIGKPISNISVYILADDLTLLPVGMVGEIFLGGVGVARGYVGNTDLTARAFILDPYNLPHKMYRTGDIGRWLPDGNIQFLGRRDQQIKINGQRIELGEIESALLSRDSISEAAVVRAGSPPVLYAFVVSSHEYSQDEFQGMLIKDLPRPMIPAVFIRIDRMPLTATGKIERKILVSTAVASSVAGNTAGLLTATQRKLLQIFRELLGRAEVNPPDNFFAIGGDSIVAIRLVNIISSAFGKEVKVSDVFQCPTVLSLGDLIDQRREINTGTRETDDILKRSVNNILANPSERMKLPADVEDIYPMADIEQGMIFHGQLQQRSSVYHDQFIYRIKDTSFNFTLFKKAFMLLVDKHSILRTSFHIDTEVPVQVVHNVDHVQSDILFKDVISMEGPKQREYIAAYMEEDRAQPFKPERPGLWRLRVFATGHNEFEVLWIFHHSIIDGWSNASLMTELSNVYFNLKQDDLFTPQPLRASYRDYVAEQLACFNDETLSFWKTQLAGFERTPLPYHKVNKDPFGKVKRFKTVLDADLSNKLLVVSEKQGINPKDIFLAAFVYLVRFVTNTSDVTIGLVTNGRPSVEDSDKVIGCFLNTIPFRTQLKDRLTGYELVNTISSKVLEVKPFEKLSLFKITKTSQLPQQASSSLFDILFDYLDFHIFKEVHRDTEILESAADIYENTNTSFDFNVVNDNGKIEVSISYIEGLYKNDDLVRIGNYYKRILEQICSWDKTLSASGIMEREEVKQLTSDFCSTRRSDPFNASIAELFVQQARRTPHREAVSDENGSLTYELLNDYSDRIAAAIDKYNFPAGSVVAIVLPRSTSLAVSIFGVWRAGMACVVLSPDQPVSRNRQLTEMARASAIITADGIFEAEANLPCISFAAATSSKTDHKVKIKANGSDLAYIIFTSGSTGIPKGIKISHSSKINHLLALIDLLNIDESSVIAQTALASFDIFMWQIVAGLLKGARVRIYSRELQMEPLSFARTIDNEGITILQHVPSYFEALFETLESNSLRLEGLKFLFTTGEELGPSLAKRWFTINPAVPLVNGYGPAEASDDVTIYIMRSEEPYERVPIGKPIQNSKVYVLNKDFDLCPVGVEGEIVISGDCLAIGYLDEQSTLERFRKVGPANELSYTTGDLGKWLPDGNLVFLGRADNQLKINGSRIEPGEVERALEEFDGIRSVAVVGKQRGGSLRSLVACYTSKYPLKVSAIREFMKGKLPDHMIPAEYIEVTSLPLSQNGKIDRAAVMKILDESAESVERILPRNENEQVIYELWKKLLGRTDFGIRDNFFEVGGNSLICVQLVSRINKSFTAGVEILDIYNNPTIEAQAGLIKEQRFSEEQIPRTDDSDSYPLSSAQQRFWYLAQHHDNALAYVDTISFVIEGQLDLNAFQEAHRYLIERHESLRTVFRAQGGEIRQFILDPQEINFRLNVLDLSMHSDHQHELKEIYSAEQLTGFDLETGPLLRASVVRLGQDRYAYFYSSHHIISDGWSIEIISSEIADAYNAIRIGNDPQLPSLHIQYKDYAVWQRKQVEDGLYERQRQYWQQQLALPLPVLDLPLDRPRRPVARHDGGSLEGTLPSSVATPLKTLALSSGCTLFSGLLACLNGILFRYTGQQDIIVGTPVAGRTHTDLEDQVGLFLNTLAIRTRFEASDTFTQLLHQVNEVVKAANSNQYYPFDLLVDDLKLTRDLSRSPAFDVMIVLQNQNTLKLTQGGGSFDGFRVARMPGLERRTSKFDLVFSFMEVGSELSLEIFYKTDLFDRKSIERLFNNFVSFSAAVAAMPGQMLKAIDYINEAEKKKFTRAFETSKLDMPREKTIQHVFESVCKVHSLKKAIQCSAVELSYAELNRQANQLADYILSNMPIGADEPIAVLSKYSEEMIVAMLGILKAGAAWVPIETALLDPSQYRIIRPPDDRAEEKGRVAGPNQHLAYVVYHAGSKEERRGVVLDHDNLIKTIFSRSDFYGIDQEIVSLLMPDNSFNNSIIDIFSTLLNGGTLIVADPSAASDPWMLDKEINSNGATHIRIAPTLYREFLDKDHGPLSSLKCVVLDSMLVHDSLVDLHHSRLNSVELVSEYNAGSNSLCAIVARLTPGQSVNMGVPQGNVNVYVLDDHMALVPVGVPGNLYVDGARTGERARRNDDGSFTFLGRMDNQVMINGYRVDPLQIENVLFSHPGINNAVVNVLIHDSNGPEFIAYLVENHIGAMDIREHTRRYLPECMVPTFFVKLERLPLTPEGNIDLKQLPSSTSDKVIRGASAQSSNSEMEVMLVTLWKEVLRRDIINIDDNYFALGGDSIRSIQISARLRDHGYQLDVPDILRYPVLKEAAARVVPIERYADQGLVEGTAIISPIQRWFLDGPNKFKGHYVQAVLFKSTAEMSVYDITQIFRKVVSHHDALRMSFNERGMSWVQENRNDQQSPAIKYFDWTQEPQDDGLRKMQAMCTELQSSFDLADELLVRVAFFKLADGNRLFIAVHHLVSDAVSWRIIMDDVATLFQQLVAGEPLVLPLKTDSYLAWTSRLLEYANSDSLLQELDYWRSIDSDTYDSLPVDLISDENLICDTKELTVRISGDTVDRIMSLNRKLGVDNHQVLLYALVTALQDTFPNTRLPIEVEGHGRENVLEGISINRTVGWFTSVYPVYLDIDQAGDNQKQLMDVKAVMEKIPNKGVGYGILRYLASTEKLDGYRFRARPEIAFNYLGHFNRETTTGKDGILDISDEMTILEFDERELRPHAIEMKCLIVDETLSVTISYSQKQFESATILRLIENYKNRLETISMTAVGDHRNLVPSEWGNSSITEDELKELLSEPENG